MLKTPKEIFRVADRAGSAGAADSAGAAGAASADSLAGAATASDRNELRVLKRVSSDANRSFQVRQTFFGGFPPARFLGFWEKHLI